MAVTVTQAASQALRLLGHVNARGALDDNRDAKYYALAVQYAQMIQTDILMRENFWRTDNPLAYKDNGDGTYTKLDVPDITALTDTFVCSDDSATRIVPYGLAMYFAQTDNDADKYSFFSQEYYGNRLPSIVAENNAIEDYYGIDSDSDLNSSN